MTKEAEVRDIMSLSVAQVKGDSRKVVATYNTSAKAFIAHFIGLCRRFPEVDKQSGLVLANFLDCLKENPRIRNAVIEKLGQFSGGKLVITQDGEKWKVQTAKIKGSKKSALKVEEWDRRVQEFEDTGASSLIAGKADKKPATEKGQENAVSKWQTVLDKLAKQVEKKPESISEVIESVETFLRLLKLRASHQAQSDTPPAAEDDTPATIEPGETPALPAPTADTVEHVLNTPINNAA